MKKNYGGAVGREVDTVVAADSIAFLIGPNCLEIVKKIKPSQHCIIVESQVMQKGKQGGFGFLPAEEGVSSGGGPDSRYVGNSVR